jgi:hypothetical protein
VEQCIVGEAQRCQQRVDFLPGSLGATKMACSHRMLVATILPPFFVKPAAFGTEL